MTFSLPVMPPLSDEDRLRSVGLRPTRQRLEIARILRSWPESHITADQAHRLAFDRGLRLPLGTVYNALNDFARAGLLGRFEHGDRSCFCLDPRQHHHFIDADTGRVVNVPNTRIELPSLPAVPDGMDVVGIDVIVKVRRS